MTIAARIRFRDIIRKVVPWWLQDRGPSDGTGPGPSNSNVGFRFLWSLVAPLDQAMQVIYEGIQAAWPGMGTPEALPYIGRSRGIVQGMTEANDHYAGRLRAWLEAHAEDSTVALARQLHEYLAGNPEIRIVTRAGDWVIVDAIGNVSFTNHAWDWDSVSDPDRSTNWSDMWIIVVPQVWIQRTGILGALTGDDGYGLGHMAPHTNADQVRQIIADWKGAHSRIRCVLWTPNSARYNPTNPSLLPDGHWGHYSEVNAGNASRFASHRDLTETRFWEPN
jgi:hypothetical protein